MLIDHEHATIGRRLKARCFTVENSIFTYKIEESAMPSMMPMMPMMMPSMIEILES